MNNTISTIVKPARNSLDMLSQLEVDALVSSSHSNLKEIFRRCALAVLNSGSNKDDVKAILAEHESFRIEIIQREEGVFLELTNAPAYAFVDGKMIEGIRELLFSVLRDILYVGDKLESNQRFDLATSKGITNAVFHILRNARAFKNSSYLDLVVCWGGHSISPPEYAYTKHVGYHLGLRGKHIVTGCGPGAMKGPMKGANVAHAKQRVFPTRYIGVSEPGIIAAEAPNPIVNKLVIMPDIEKRLEAFVRMSHAVIVFPGGAGTMEEILYLLGILLNPENKHIPFPLIFTGPECAADYFAEVDKFIGNTLGEEARAKYQIIIDNPTRVALTVNEELEKVKIFRKEHEDAYYFNWLLKIEHDFQIPFNPTHKSVRAQKINQDLPPHELAANLRRVFSAIVAGNVKEQGIREIEKHGPWQISGDAYIMDQLDKLLESFVKQQRMKLPGTEYTPCYDVIK